MEILITALFVYLVIGAIVAYIEYKFNDSDKLEWFDIVNWLFWLPLSLFFDKGKLYKAMHRK